MLKSLFRRTPEILFVTAVFLLAIQMLDYVGGTLSIARSGLQLENFELYSRLLAAFGGSLFQPAILFGFAAVTAVLRDQAGG